MTLSEIERALFDMEAGKTPGLDGLPAGGGGGGADTHICEVLNGVFEKGKLSKSQQTGLITLLFKKKGSREDLANWRPISLMNVDCKILTKILANRVGLVLHTIINADQTCSVAGRSIGQWSFFQVKSDPGVFRVYNY